MKPETEKVIFGGGCFWCTEAVFKMLRGIVKTIPGYAGGTRKDPTYEDVCSGTTGHAEVLEVEYDPKVARFDKLLAVFFEMHDPTSKNQQGADIGTQYRSIILYTTEAQKETIKKFFAEAQKKLPKPIVTEVKKLDKFYPSEDYHKDYYAKNPLNPYCIFVTRPKLEKIKKEFEADLK